jgi:hypothetical protein
MRYSTLRYKTDCVLDDFVQLKANLSILNTFTVGWAKLTMFGRLDVVNTFSVYNILICGGFYQDLIPS